VIATTIRHNRALGAIASVMWAAGCATEPLPTEPPAARLEAITATSVTGTVGTQLVPAPAVRATDEDGRGVPGVAVAFQAGDGSGPIAHPTVTTDTTGSATVGSWTLGPAVGAQRLTARVAGLPDVTFTAMARAGPVAQLTPQDGNDQVADLGKSLPQPLLARVADSFGNPVAGAPVTFTVINGGGSIDGDVAVTDVNGVAVSGPWTLGAEAGLQQVSAASGAAQVAFRAFALAPPAPLAGQIAFVSLADPSVDIAVVNADGTGFRRLTHAGLDLQPAWSPDGSRIAFVSDGGGGDQHIYVMTADGTNVSRLTDGRFDLDPAWSPDGSTIAFSSLRDGSAQIATLSTADGSLTVLTDLPGFEAQPTWSPDGRQLAFVSDYVAYDFVFDIYTMKADGTGQTRRTQGFAMWPNIRYYLHPAWSPDGSMIAFLLGEIISGTSAMRFSVTLMTPDGVWLKQLASAGDISWNEALDPGSLTWSPDGRGIAYSFIDGGGVWSVRYVSLDGSRMGTIVSNAHSPSWRR
jgi:WD40 repeat protein